MIKTIITKSSFHNIYQSPGLKTILAKIKALLKLEPGWDFGEGEAISKDVANRALSVAEYGLTYRLNANVRPSSEGELIISLFKENRFLFISVTPDNTYNLEYETGIGANYDSLDSRENMNLASLFKYITEWALSELYTSTNMTVMHTASQAIPLESTRMVKSPYLMNNVQMMPAMAQYADISSAFTTPQSETRYAFAE